MAKAGSRHGHPKLGTSSGKSPTTRGAIGTALAIFLIASAFTLVLIAGTPGVAAAAESPVEGTPASASAPVTAAPAGEVTRTRRSPRLHMHGLGLGYHAVVFGTEASDRYSVHGPAVVYDYFIGGRWGFLLRLSAFTPILGTMTGPSGEFAGSLTGTYDERRYGVDGQFLAARRLPLSARLVLTGGLGLHVQAFSLAGTSYSPVETATLGLGGLGKLDFLLSDWLSLDVQLATGLDLIDLIDHKNPAQWAVPLSLSFAVAARY